MSGEMESARSGSRPRELYLFSRLTRTWALTGADEAATYVGVTYERVAIASTEAEFSSEAQAGNITVTLRADSEMVVGFVGRLSHAPLYLTRRRVQPNGEATCDFVGQVLKADFDGPNCVLTCAPLVGALTRLVPSLVFQSRCPRRLYGPGCEVVKSVYAVRATIETANGSHLQSVAFAQYDDGYFNGGWVELDDGDRRYVRHHVGGSIELGAPFARVVALDSVVVYPGCDRTEATCAAKYNNKVNCLAFSHIPSENPYEGRIV